MFTTAPNTRKSSRTMNLESLEGRQLMSVAVVATPVVAKAAIAQATAPVVANALSPASSVVAATTMANRACDPKLAAAVSRTAQAGAAATADPISQPAGLADAARANGIVTAGKPSMQSANDLMSGASYTPLTVQDIARQDGNSAMAGLMDSVAGRFGTTPLGALKDQKDPLGGLSADKGANQTNFTTLTKGTLPSGFQADGRAMEGETTTSATTTTTTDTTKPATSTTVPQTGTTQTGTTKQGTATPTAGTTTVTLSDGTTFTCGQVDANTTVGCEPLTKEQVAKREARSSGLITLAGKAWAAILSAAGANDNWDDKWNGSIGVRGMTNPDYVDPNAQVAPEIAALLAMNPHPNQPSTQPAPVLQLDPAGAHPVGSVDGKKAMDDKTGELGHYTDEHTSSSSSVTAINNSVRLPSVNPNDLKDPGSLEATGVHAPTPRPQ